MGIELAEVRRLALALPEVEEYEHGDLPAFRVAGTRFESMLDADGINLTLGEEGIRAAVGAWPGACRRLREDVFAGLLEEAWGRRAPARLRRLR